jgi:hypothetical protein
MPAPEAQLVDDRLTPLSVEDGMLALYGGYERILGAPPERPSTLAALGAQLCLESGNFKKAHCYNWGNKKCPKDWAGLYCRFKCDELFDERTAALAQRLGPCVVNLWKGGPLYRVVLLPPHPWTEFTAYESAEEGAADYVRLLATRDRYRAAWSAAHDGDAAGFSRALGAARYYTAEVESYTRGIVSIASRLAPLCERLVAEHAEQLSEDEREHIEALVALTLAESLTDLAKPAPDEDPIA